MEPSTLDRAHRIAGQVLTGVLRHDSPKKIWGGTGDGQPCVACGHGIGSADLEIEAAFPDGQTLWFHTPCFLAWEHAAMVRRGMAPIS